MCSLDRRLRARVLRSQGRAVRTVGRLRCAVAQLIRRDDDHVQPERNLFQKTRCASSNDLIRTKERLQDFTSVSPTVWFFDVEGRLLRHASFAAGKWTSPLSVATRTAFAGTRKSAATSFSGFSAVFQGSLRFFRWDRQISSPNRTTFPEDFQASETSLRFLKMIEDFFLF